MTETMRGLEKFNADFIYLVERSIPEVRVNACCWCSPNNMTTHGWHFILPNGITISVQFGPDHYCDSRNTSPDRWKVDSLLFFIEKSYTAEIAIIAANGDFIRPDGWDDDVKAHMTPREVLSLIALYA